MTETPAVLGANDSHDPPPSYEHLNPLTRPVTMEARGGKVDVRVGLELIAAGVDTGEIKEVEGTKYRIVRPPTPKEVVKAMRIANPGLQGNMAMAIVKTFKTLGWNHAPVARFRCSHYVVDDWICPVCRTDWNAKIEPKPLLVLQRIDPSQFAEMAGEAAARQYANAINVIQCRTCLLKCRNFSLVDVVIPHNDGSGKGTHACVVLTGLVPLVPNTLLPKMAQAWDESGGLLEAFLARSAAIGAEWMEKNPELAAAFGLAGQKKPTIFKADGTEVS